MVSLDARQLSQNLALLSTAAENISERVSILDLNKSRVVECLQRTNDLRDLRTCAEGVEKALKEQDYEEAAQAKFIFKIIEILQ
jgi:hypothetical protein